MHISIRHSYAADPATVHAMMADEKWLTAVAKETGATTWEVAGSDQVSHVHAEVPAPARAKQFTGPTLSIDLDITWQPVRADGGRDGEVTVKVAGLPAKLAGTANTQAATVAGQPGTTVDYEAEFSINIPLVGGKLEEAAAPYVQRVIDLQQDVGNKYLTGDLV
ncbi:hypothetical protein GCM10009785_00470 [Brooklawnia cerclae]|uniref:DUF2505 domain-containing protein n=1 Tax=Brooklawnia cerclae TaxID=349934 RepID=A0ABX0SD73_9ACTN|nr:DUF2505 domain-containing protein [Brooklawnia cerclae]NIH56358.1 hypothetical protein [Brooklawnia cerclae]